MVLEWAATYPERLCTAVPIASASHHSAQNIAFDEVGRQAIMADPDWRGGNYQEEGTIPYRGLAIARMVAHITYLSEPSLQRKFGRRLQDRSAVTFGFDADRDFDIVHSSNMSKLCSTEEEAQETVAKYESEFKEGKSPCNRR